MTLDESLTLLLARYREAARQAEEAGDDAGAEMFTRRRDRLAGWIGYRSCLAAKRDEAIRSQYSHLERY
ncbi:MAG TPA: hypothetical protein VMG10_19445 [Gemmataceae bacterium]|nr:hypothetical protein [Gemmataceae bacterium]